MSTITQLDPAYDLWLSYTWNPVDHGVCGHIFEVFDYYYVLRKHFRVGIFFGENVGWPTIELAIRSKYTFSEELIAEIKLSTVFGNKPKILKGRNILFTDGGITNPVHLYFDNIFYFACGQLEIKDNNKDNIYVLQDDRVYEPVKRNGINYKKRILFDQLRPAGASKNRYLVYATQNCRGIDSIEELRQYGSILAIVNSMPEPVDGIEFATPPIEDLFTEFTTYIYTPVKRQWDCSPRFIAECHYYGKPVVYHNIDYWDQDRGLFYRRWDIENEFQSLYLSDDDEIVDIVRDIIC